ncbi:MAG TPA: VCBS repeat-containing protein, partial [Methylomirabilota bacterium]|nr:VCBS repeat-containing protein [Methylomirabilota bacterium]
MASKANGVVSSNDAFCGPSNTLALARLAPPQSAGTRRMVERLERIHKTADPRAFPFMNDRRADLLEQRLRFTTNYQGRVSVGYDLAVELMFCGRTEAALKQFQAVEDAITSAGAMDGLGRSQLRMQKAIAMLRLGEQENCQLNHNSESCLFPLPPAAHHQLPRGSRGAVTLLSDQLQEFPQDLSARWLLNIAHMTLGEYPDKVPAPWLIPPKAFASEYDLPRFPNVAGALGLDVDTLAGGTILDDFDNDGFIDIVASAWGMTGQLRFFHNDGNGQFTERTVEAGLVGLVSGLNIQQT